MAQGTSVPSWSTQLTGGRWVTMSNAGGKMHVFVRAADNRIVAGPAEVVGANAAHIDAHHGRGEGMTQRHATGATPTGALGQKTLAYNPNPHPLGSAAAGHGYRQAMAISGGAEPAQGVHQPGLVPAAPMGTPQSSVAQAPRAGAGAGAGSDQRSSPGLPPQAAPPASPEAGRAAPSTPLGGAAEPPSPSSPSSPLGGTGVLGGTPAAVPEPEGAPASEGAPGDEHAEALWGTRQQAIEDFKAFAHQLQQKYPSGDFEAIDPEEKAHWQTLYGAVHDATMAYAAHTGNAVGAAPPVGAAEEGTPALAPAPAAMEEGGAAPAAGTPEPEEPVPSSLAAPAPPVDSGAAPVDSGAAAQAQPRLFENPNQPQPLHGMTSGAAAGGAAASPGGAMTEGGPADDVVHRQYGDTTRHYIAEAFPGAHQAIMAGPTARHQMQTVGDVARGDHEQRAKTVERVGKMALDRLVQDGYHPLVGQHLGQQTARVAARLRAQGQAAPPVPGPVGAGAPPPLPSGEPSGETPAAPGASSGGGAAPRLSGRALIAGGQTFVGHEKGRRAQDERMIRQFTDEGRDDLRDQALRAFKEDHGPQAHDALARDLGLGSARAAPEREGAPPPRPTWGAVRPKTGPPLQGPGGTQAQGVPPSAQTPEGTTPVDLLGGEQGGKTPKQRAVQSLPENAKAAAALGEGALDLGANEGVQRRQQQLDKRLGEHSAPQGEPWQQPTQEGERLRAQRYDHQRRGDWLRMQERPMDPEVRNHVAHLESHEGHAALGAAIGAAIPAAEAASRAEAEGRLAQTKGKRARAAEEKFQENLGGLQGTQESNLKQVGGLLHDYTRAGNARDREFAMHALESRIRRGDLRGLELDDAPPPTGQGLRQQELEKARQGLGGAPPQERQEEGARAPSGPTSASAGAGAHARAQTQGPGSPVGPSVSPVGPEEDIGTLHQTPEGRSKLRGLVEGTFARHDINNDMERRALAEMAGHLHHEASGGALGAKQHEAIAAFRDWLRPNLERTRAGAAGKADYTPDHSATGHEQYKALVGKTLGHQGVDELDRLVYRARQDHQRAVTQGHDDGRLSDEQLTHLNTLSRALWKAKQVKFPTSSFGRQALSEVHGALPGAERYLNRVNPDQVAMRTGLQTVAEHIHAHDPDAPSLAHIQEMMALHGGTLRLPSGGTRAHASSPAKAAPPAAGPGAPPQRSRAGEERTPPPAPAPVPGPAAAATEKGPAAAPKGPPEAKELGGPKGAALEGQAAVQPQDGGVPHPGRTSPEGAGEETPTGLAPEGGTPPVPGRAGGAVSQTGEGALEREARLQNSLRRHQQHAHEARAQGDHAAAGAHEEAAAEVQRLLAGHRARGAAPEAQPPVAPPSGGQAAEKTVAPTPPSAQARAGADVPKEAEDHPRTGRSAPGEREPTPAAPESVPDAQQRYLGMAQHPEQHKEVAALLQQMTQNRNLPKKLRPALFGTAQAIEGYHGAAGDADRQAPHQRQIERMLPHLAPEMVRQEGRNAAAASSRQGASPLPGSHRPVTQHMPPEETPPVAPSVARGGAPAPGAGEGESVQRRAARQDEERRNAKSTGHQAHIGDFEYFQHENGNLYRANRANPMGTDGYRQGGRYEAPSHMVESTMQRALEDAGHVSGGEGEATKKTPSPEEPPSGYTNPLDEDKGAVAREETPPVPGDGSPKTTVPTEPVKMAAEKKPPRSEEGPPSTATPGYTNPLQGGQEAPAAPEIPSVETPKGTTRVAGTPPSPSPSSSPDQGKPLAGTTGASPRQDQAKPPAGKTEEASVHEPGAGQVEQPPAQPGGEEKKPNAPDLGVTGAAGTGAGKGEGAGAEKGEGAEKGAGAGEGAGEKVSPAAEQPRYPGWNDDAMTKRGAHRAARVAQGAQADQQAQAVQHMRDHVSQNLLRGGQKTLNTEDDEGNPLPKLRSFEYRAGDDRDGDKRLPRLRAAALHDWYRAGTPAQQVAVLAHHAHVFDDTVGPRPSDPVAQRKWAVKAAMRTKGAVGAMMEGFEGTAHRAAAISPLVAERYKQLTDALVWHARNEGRLLAPKEIRSLYGGTEEGRVAAAEPINHDHVAHVLRQFRHENHAAVAAHAAEQRARAARGDVLADGREGHPEVGRATFGEAARRLEALAEHKRLWDPDEEHVDHLLGEYGRTLNRAGLQHKYDELSAALKKKQALEHPELGQVGLGTQQEVAGHMEKYLKKLRKTELTGKGHRVPPWAGARTPQGEITTAPAPAAAGGEARRGTRFRVQQTEEGQWAVYRNKKPLSRHGSEEEARTEMERQQAAAQDDAAERRTSPSAPRIGFSGTAAVARANAYVDMVREPAGARRFYDVVQHAYAQTTDRAAKLSLGEVGKHLERIANDPTLSDEERAQAHSSVAARVAGLEHHLDPSRQALSGQGAKGPTVSAEARRTHGEEARRALERRTDMALDHLDRVGTGPLVRMERGPQGEKRENRTLYDQTREHARGVQEVLDRMRRVDPDHEAVADGHEALGDLHAALLRDALGRARKELTEGRGGKPMGSGLAQGRRGLIESAQRELANVAPDHPLHKEAQDVVDQLDDIVGGPSSLQSVQEGTRAGQKESERTRIMREWKADRARRGKPVGSPPEQAEEAAGGTGPQPVAQSPERAPDGVAGAEGTSAEGTSKTAPVPAQDATEDSGEDQLRRSLAEERNADPEGVERHRQSVEMARQQVAHDVERRGWQAHMDDPTEIVGDVHREVLGQHGYHDMDTVPQQAHDEALEHAYDILGEARDKVRAEGGERASELGPGEHQVTPAGEAPAEGVNHAHVQAIVGRAQNDDVGDLQVKIDAFRKVAGNESYRPSGPGGQPVTRETAEEAARQLEAIRDRKEAQGPVVPEEAAPSQAATPVARAPVKGAGGGRTAAQSIGRRLQPGDVLQTPGGRMFVSSHHVESGTVRGEIGGKLVSINLHQHSPDQISRVVKESVPYINPLAA